MPSTPLHAAPSRNAPLRLVIAALALAATALTGCATSSDRLVAAAPQGVDLSGQWQLNLNLSDDPANIEQPKEPDKDLPRSRSPGGFGKPGTTMPGMPTGPGSIDPGAIDPGGEPPRENLTDSGGRGAVGLVPVLYAQSADLPGSASDSGPPTPAAKPAREGSVTRMLEAPALLTISQSGSKLVVKYTSDGITNEYTAGEQRTIPFGGSEADRSSGWRDAAFVVITKAKKGPSKEDDFALDSEGHLIFATLVTHVKKGPIDFKRVYDRVRTPN
jgi:hypothetical protein